MPLESLYAPVVSASWQRVCVSDRPAVTCCAHRGRQPATTEMRQGGLPRPCVPPRIRFARATTSAGIAATIAGSSSRDGQVHRARTCRYRRCSARPRPDTRADEMRAVAAHLARESERLLSDRLRVANVAEDHVRERARLAFLQCLHVRLPSYERVTGVTRQRTHEPLHSRKPPPHGQLSTHLSTHHSVDHELAAHGILHVLDLRVDLLRRQRRKCTAQHISTNPLSSPHSTVPLPAPSTQPTQHPQTLNPKPRASKQLATHTCHGGPAPAVQGSSGCVVRPASQRHRGSRATQAGLESCGVHRTHGSMQETPRTAPRH